MSHTIAAPWVPPGIVIQYPLCIFKKPFNNIEGLRNHPFWYYIRSRFDFDGVDRWSILRVLEKEYDIRKGGMTGCEFKLQCESYFLKMFGFKGKKEHRVPITLLFSKVMRLPKNPHLRQFRGIYTHKAFIVNTKSYIQPRTLRIVNKNQ